MWSGLTWNRADRKEGIVRLEPGETQNKEGRTPYLNKELSKLMHVQQLNRRLGCPYVFHKEGEKIGEFRKSWVTAFIQSGLGAPYKCKACGNLVTMLKEVGWRKRLCPKCKGKGLKWAGKIFHDFRRTTVRNRVRSGISERVAMTLSGHKTRSIFDRHNIVNQEDLREAAKRQGAYLQAQMVTI